MKVLVTGCNGQLGNALKESSVNYSTITWNFTDHSEMDITDCEKVHNAIEIFQPDWIINSAAFTDVDGAEFNQELAFSVNAEGPFNLAKAATLVDAKLLHISTDYVYDGIDGNYKETDPLLPKNNYAWSKVGGESSVQMYNNSLILRACMTEKPFVHKKAFYDFKTNFIFHEEVAKILFKLINKKGVINLGGKAQTVYKFAKKYNPKIKKIYAKKILSHKYPLNPSMNVKKLNKIIK